MDSSFNLDSTALCLAFRYFVGEKPKIKDNFFFSKDSICISFHMKNRLAGETAQDIASILETDYFTSKHTLLTHNIDIQSQK